MEEVLQTGESRLRMVEMELRAEIANIRKTFDEALAAGRGE
jgi:hypothetical protein